jgi:hypothetical protein
MSTIASGQPNGDFAPRLRAGRLRAPSRPLALAGALVAFCLASQPAQAMHEWKCQRTGAPQIRVTNSAQLQNALSTAPCGREIILANGSYSGSFTASRYCSETTPILIRAANRLLAKVQSRIALNGSFTCVSGLDFVGTATGATVGGRSNRVLGNRFSGWRNAAIEVPAGTGAVISYNELSRPAAWLPPEGQPTQIRMGIRLRHSSDPESVHLNGRIYRNYFHHFPAKPIPSQYSSGQSDAVTVCASVVPAFADGTRAAGWEVDYNLIENHQGGHGVIDIKCGGVKARFNTLVNSPGGRIDIRIGRDTELSGNWIENAGGMLLHGGYHKIFGNRLINTSTGLALEAGDVEWNYRQTNSPGTTRVATRRVYALHLAGNVAPVIVGKTYSGVPYTLPAFGTLVEKNTGSVRLGLHSNTTIRSTTSVTVPVAQRLSPSAVGLSAMPAQY